MVSNAALRSKRMRIVSRPESAAMRRSLVTLIEVVSVQWRGNQTGNVTGSVHKGRCGIKESGVD